ncbi:ABC transporter ATP-binding protein [Rhodococcus rhodnii]|uniref:ABC peptide transporter n=2 Tax=Rhodococcus rhodnii TaxID=38312 RepID=R7WMJ2_9NOCA|nr:ABC transporter ATP-binding protein [Rhodococcus rhodnii]EOM75219.1 ABC peptide transporter [Rhodococcus rhodnii LMG 5362]TXG89240.1 ABC transporter ATP-binding protein [Rhodococcus rhodnii]
MTTTTPETDAAAANALDVESLTVSFDTDAGPLDAVRGVTIRVRPGEVLAVVGESGSGKSVTARTAIGLLPPTAHVSGRVVLGGTDVSHLSDKQWTALRGKDVAMVFQEPGAALDPLCTVGSQLVEALRAHPAAGGRRRTRAEARERAVELLDAVGIPEPERRWKFYPHELSGGQKQRVMIAIAIANDPEVILADEPTTALDVTVQAEILRLLLDLRDRLGCAIVLVTHNMGVVRDVADRVVVMRDGVVVEEAPVDELFRSPAAEYTRALLDAVPALAPAESLRPVDRTGPPVLDVDRLVVEFPGAGRHRFRAVDDVSFRVHRGETIGLVGESGSGKSTIGRCVAALQRPTSGTVTIDGEDLFALSRRQLRDVRRRIGFVFQDPATALNPRLTVGDCVAEPLVVHGSTRGAAVRRSVEDVLDSVHLPKGVVDRYPHELSGGQRQRANLARALVLGPELLVADEPTSALDVSVQAAVLDLFEELQRRHAFACLFISHDLAVIDRLSHRVVVLGSGGVVEEGTPWQILREPEQEYTRTLVASIPGQREL